jgi:glycosyltransferase involved in cell wall biosynthesis
MDLNYQKKFESSDQIIYTIENLNKADKIITVSYQNKKSLLEVASGIENKTQVIYNIFNVEEVKNKSQESISEKKYESLQLVAVGRLPSHKGFDRLIKICHKLKNENKLDFNLWIVGEGDEKGILQSQIQNLDLEDTIKLLGFKENPYPYLREADLFVLSSRHESFCNVVLEAMILNKPIVSTDVSGPGELLKANLPEGDLVSKGEYGLLTENSEEGLYEGLKKMITDKTLRETFINKNPYFSAFETSNVVKKVEALFDEVMSE